VLRRAQFQIGRAARLSPLSLGPAALRPQALTVRSMCGPAAPAEKSEEEKAKIKAEREARKAAKEEEQRKQREEKEAKKKAQADAAAAALAELRKPISYSTPELPARVVGDYETMQSRGTTGRTWADMSKLGEAGGAQAGEQVWVRGTKSQKDSVY